MPVLSFDTFFSMRSFGLLVAFYHSILQLTVSKCISKVKDFLMIKMRYFYVI